MVLGVHGAACDHTNRSRSTAESHTESPTSWIEKYTSMVVALVTGTVTRSSGVTPSYVVPVGAYTPNTVFTVIRLPSVSTAKLLGANTTVPLKVRLLSLSCAVKASLNGEPTYSGNSSE